MQEVWKAVPDFEGYEVSNLGQVRSYYSRKGGWILSNTPQCILSQSTRSGHPFVCLRKDGKSYARQVHSLVALAFIGPRPKGMQVCHGDCSPLNNHLDNLRYDTPSGNALDTIRVNGYTNRLSRDDALRIRLDFANGLHVDELVSRYEVSTGTIYNILAHRAFREIGGPRFNGNKLPPQSIEEIKSLHCNGMSLSKLSKKYNRHPSAISRIINDKTYKSSQS